MSAATAARLDTRLAGFEAETGRQVFVAIFPKLPSPSLEDFTVRTAQAWRIGRKGLDDGAILFVFVQDRKLRIEVGYGLEGQIPDAIASRIIDERIAPLLKAGQADAALSAGVEALLAAASGQRLPAPASATDGDVPTPAPEIPTPPREPTPFDVAFDALKGIASYEVAGLPLGLGFLILAFPTLTSPVLRFLPIRHRVKRGEPLPKAWLIESAILLWVIVSNLGSSRSGGGRSYGGGRSSGGGGRFGGGGASGSW